MASGDMPWHVPTTLQRHSNIKYSYFADNDSVVLYGFYPQAYTPESKNERWTIRKLSSDSLTVFVHNSTLELNGDTLTTAGNEIEIFTHK